MHTRRRFLKTVAATAAITPTAAPALARAGEPDAPTPAQALTDLVRARFGRHLTEAQLKSAQREVASLLRAADAIARVPLENTEEPAFVFVAEPEE